MKLSVLSNAVVLALLSNTALAETESTDNTNTETIVVTATKGQTSLSEAPASISVITNEELNRIPVNDIASALESVAGVHVDRSSSSEPNIVIRGLRNNNISRSNYTLLLVNGRRINSNETMIRGAGFDFSSIPMSAIDHIEVIRGPMSSLYGSDAIGGVVNVILKEPTEDTRVNASVSYSQPEDGGGAMAKSNVFVSGAAIPGKLLYTVSAEVSQQDKWSPDDVADGNNFSGNADQERSGAHTALTWLVNDQNKILLDLGYLKDDRVFPGSDNDSTDDDDINNGEKFTAGIGHQGEWKWGSNDINYLYENSKIYNATSGLDIANAKQQNHSVDGKIAITALERQIITAGFDATHTAISIDRDYEDTPSVNEKAVFIQDQIDITKNLTGTLSGRLTDHSEFGSEFTPRAYLVYSATDRLTVKGGYAEGFKTPTIYQSNENFAITSCGGRGYLTGNPDLKAETSKTFELATSYNGDNWFVQATTFVNHINNMIDRDTSQCFTDAGYATYYNIEEEVESKGIELEGQVNVTDDISVSANATYTRSINTTDNSELESVPRWLSNVSLNWYATDRLSLFTSANYTGKQTGYSYNQSDDIWYSPYIIANLGGSYAINDQWTVKAGITNFLDENLESDDQDYIESEVGRTYYITIDMAL